MIRALMMPALNRRSLRWTSFHRVHACIECRAGLRLHARCIEQSSRLSCRASAVDEGLADRSPDGSHRFATDEIFRVGLLAEMS